MRNLNKEIIHLAKIKQLDFDEWSEQRSSKKIIPIKLNENCEFILRFEARENLKKK